jgi:hypothetical protein
MCINTQTYNVSHVLIHLWNLNVKVIMMKKMMMGHKYERGILREDQKEGSRKGKGTGGEDD